MNSCAKTEVLTAKFFDAEEIADGDDLQQPRDDSTTVLNETFLEFHPSALTLEEVDMQNEVHDKTSLLRQEQCFDHPGPQQPFLMEH